MASVYSSVSLEPVKTVSTVSPLGTALLENVVDPPKATSKSPPDETYDIYEQQAQRRIICTLTAVKVVGATPLPQVSLSPLTPQSPFEEVMVKLEVVPVSVIVANVCVDHVPRVRSPPTSAFLSIATIIALVGIAEGAYIHD